MILNSMPQICRTHTHTDGGLNCTNVEEHDELNSLRWLRCVFLLFFSFFSLFSLFFHLLSFSHLVRGNVMHVKSLFQIVFIIYYIFFVVAIVVSFISRLSHIKCGMRVVYHMSYFYMIRILCDNTNSFLSGWFFSPCNYQPNERTSIQRAREKTTYI